MKTVVAALIVVLACVPGAGRTEESPHRLAEDMETYLWRSTANLMFYLVQTRGDIDKDALADYATAISEFEEHLSRLEDISTPDIRDGISALKIDWELVKQSGKKLIAVRAEPTDAPATLFDEFWDRIAAAEKDVGDLIETTATPD